MLQVNKLSIGHGGTALYEALAFEVQPGHLTALLGRNGSGKTTLLRVLAGFEKPQAGQVLLDGQDVHRLAARNLAHKVAVVTTEKPSMGYFSAYDVVMLGRHPYRQQNTTDEAAVDEALRLTGTAQLAHRQYDSLSDGEKQTILVARALAQDTPYLLLDEPTAHLDFVARQQFFSLLQAIARQSGKGILIATHEVLLALSFADHILFLEKGGAWAWGKAEALSQNERLKKAFF